MKERKRERGLEVEVECGDRSRRSNIDGTLAFSCTPSAERDGSQR